MSTPCRDGAGCQVHPKWVRWVSWRPDTGVPRHGRLRRGQGSSGHGTCASRCAPAHRARDGLLASKLARPRVPLTYVARPEVDRLLDEGTRRPLTVVSAGAGWGKTLAAAHWAAAVGGRGTARWRGSRSPTATTSRVPSGRTSSPPLAGTGHRAAGAPAGPAGAGPRRRERVHEPADDRAGHPAVHRGAGSRRLPRDPRARGAPAARPSCWRTRSSSCGWSSSPARTPRCRCTGLRLSDQLGELRSRDLAFGCCRRHPPVQGSQGLDVGAADAALLVERTEGWPAGLRLAALHLSREGGQTAARLRRGRPVRHGLSRGGGAGQPARRAAGVPAQDLGRGTLDE